MIKGEGEFPTNEHLNQALSDNPFLDLIEKFHGKYNSSSEMLDELYEALVDSPNLEQLIDSLANEPTYTTVYRYDPFSMSQSQSGGRCFGGEIYHGASTAYLRVFEHLQPDDIQLLRTESEVMVAITKPSTLFERDKVAVESDEPTVLFTSRQLDNLTKLFGRSEEDEIGLVIKSGNSLSEAIPPKELISSGMQSGYYNHFLRAHMNAQN